MIIIDYNFNLINNLYSDEFGKLNYDYMENVK